MPKNPPQCGEQNPLMWGFIPHAMGKIYAKKRQMEKYLDIHCCLNIFFITFAQE
mgnify:CR=1 FL=1